MLVVWLFVKSRQTTPQPVTRPYRPLYSTETQGRPAAVRAAGKVVELLLRLFVTNRETTHQPAARPLRQLCSTETHKHPAAVKAARKAFVQLHRKHAPVLPLAVPLSAGPEPGKASSHETGACVSSAHPLKIVLRPFLKLLCFILG